MATNSTALILPPPPTAATNATNEVLRAARPPVDIPSEWTWLWWTLGTLALLALGLWAWRTWLKNILSSPPTPPVPPHVRARQRLEAALRLIAQPRPFCIEVSDTLRIYLEERFNFHAPERTTEEFLLELQTTRLLAPDQKQSLGEFLFQCDLVKFARHEPGEAALRNLHTSAVKLVEDTAPVPAIPAAENSPQPAAPA